MQRKSIPVVLLGSGRVGKRFREIALETEVATRAPGISVRGTIGRETVTYEAVDASYARNDPGKLTNLFRGPEPAVLVDASSGDTAELHLNWLARGWPVVSANKRPISGTQDQFDELMRAAAGGERCRYWFETTVGAGLPVIRTLREMVATGDARIGFTAALSGTLGFVTEHCSGGGKMKHAIVAAREFGYTEPDPREDLSGQDVLRKAMILARLTGWRGNAEQASFAPFLEPELLEGGNWLNRIDVRAAPLIKRLRGNRKAGDRYVATLSESGLRVGFLPLDRDCEMAKLEGADNMVSFFTQRYENGLRISGPGAGVDVTAAGLLGDVYRSAGIL